MPEIASKWAGKCRSCGGLVRPGELVHWDPEEKGVRHVSAAACVFALEHPLRGPQPEHRADREKVEHLLLSHPWRAATSEKYKAIPHEYTLRKQWPVVDDFIWTVEYLRSVGYEQVFGGRVFIYYDIAERQYWDYGNGDPRALAVKDQTILINRAVRKPAAATEPRLW